MVSGLELMFYVWIFLQLIDFICIIVWMNVC